MTELQKSPQVDLKGYLLRYETAKGRSGWKKRWAVLCDYCLYLYKDQASKECFFALLLPSSKVTQSHDSTGQYRSSIKVEEPNQQPVYLSTETPLDFEMWFEALFSASQMRKNSVIGLPTTDLQQLQFTGSGVQQQFSSQNQTVITTTTTTTTQQQQQLQRSGTQVQQSDGYSLEINGRSSLQRQQQEGYDYRDGGSVDGRYSVRQNREAAAAADFGEPSGSGVVRGNGSFSYGYNGPSGSSGAFVTEARIERTVAEQVSTLPQQQQDQQHEMIVRAEPIRPAPPPVPPLSTGRYEVRTEVTRQQQQHQAKLGGGYGLAGMSGSALGASNFSLNSRRIETVREDPQMDDSEVIATAPLDEIKRKYPVSGLAKRMSIAASDLLGKSHDELLLLLIQLNREKASLERRRDYYQALLRRQPEMRGSDRMLSELREIENQIELHDPLITFIGNIISMGALYNGDDVMFASEYRQHLLQPGEIKPVKANVGFIRRQQERQVSRQFSDQQGSVDRMDSSPAAPAAESHEFRVTRQQLETELHELESVYAEHRRRKGDLAAFMTDLGRRVASGRLGVTLSGLSHHQQQATAGTYLETDLDTNLCVDLSAKFPHRRTAVGVSVGGSATIGSSSGVSSLPMHHQQLQQRQIVSSISEDEVFQAQQRPQQQSQPMTITSSSTRLPDPEDYLRQRRIQQQQQQQAPTATTVTLTSSGQLGGAGLPPGMPPAEVYVSQPVLYHSGGGGDRASNVSGGMSLSVQDRLNLALGLDTTDSLALPPVVRSKSTSGNGSSSSSSRIPPPSSPGVKKQLITLDAERYKRNTNFACNDLPGRGGSGDHRTEALENLGQFVEDMRGLQRGTYYRVEQ